MRFQNPDLQRFFDEYLKPGIEAMEAEIKELQRRVKTLENEPRVFTLKVQAERDKKE